MNKVGDIREYLLSKDVNISTETSSQYVLDCPVCGKEKKVYMGKNNGIWDCKSCSAKGNIYTFKVQQKMDKNIVLSEQTVEKYMHLLRANDRAQDYLVERGFTAKTMTSEKIGCHENGNITIPFYNRAKELYAIKYRNLQFEEQLENYEHARAANTDAAKPHKWYSVGHPGIGGLDKLDFSKPVILTEGEWDRLALLEYGFTNVGSIPGATTRNWIEELKDAKDIRLVYDNDAVGSNGAFEAASRLGLGRCYKVVLPEIYKDVNEAMLKGFTFGQMKDCIDQADKFPVAGISKSDRFTDLVLEDLLNPGKLKGVPTGYNKLDAITGGFTGQELRVVSGNTSVGKTTFIMDEMLRYVKQDIPCAIFSLETPVKKIIKDMVQQVSEVPINTLTQEQLAEKIQYLSDMPLYWFDARNFEDNFSVAKFRDLVKQARDRHGIKFVVLDDLDFLITSSPRYQNETEVVSNLMTELKTTANILNMHIVVVAHILKSVGEGVPRMKDIRGSGAIMQRSDYVEIIHRETAPDADEAIKADVTVVIEKNRPLGETGMLHFKYDKTRKIYRED